MKLDKEQFETFKKFCLATQQGITYDPQARIFVGTISEGYAAHKATINGTTMPINGGSIRSIVKDIVESGCAQAGCLEGIFNKEFLNKATLEIVALETNYVRDALASLDEYEKKGDPVNEWVIALIKNPEEDYGYIHNGVLNSLVNNLGGE